MFEPIWKSETTAAFRRITFDLISSTDHFSAANPTVTGVKVRLAAAGVDFGASTNDIVALSSTNHPGRHYLELTAAEVTALGSGPVSGYLKPTGCDPMSVEAFITDYNPRTDGASATTVADAFLARNQQGGSNASPTVSQALASGLIKFSIAAGTITVQHGDGTTAFTRTLSRDATLLLGAILSGS